jgi:hypothetical protein
MKPAGDVLPDLFSRLPSYFRLISGMKYSPIQSNLQKNSAMSYVQSLKPVPLHGL